MWIIFICLTIPSIVLASSDDARIVKGQNAKEGEFPFVISLRYKSRHTCGGTILNEQYILTAAHCICSSNYDLKHDPTHYSIQYDSTKISNDSHNTIEVEKIFCSHDQKRSIIKDWAVLKLKEPLPKGNWEPVKLSETFDTSKEQKGTIVGWGKISPEGPLSENLQKLDVTVYDDEICGKDYDTEHHICFGAETGGACNGDSGTCLLVDGVQVGIASFITDTCGIATKEHPNVYARVETYYKWIKDIADL